MLESHKSMIGSFNNKVVTRKKVKVYFEVLQMMS